MMVEKACCLHGCPNVKYLLVTNSNGRVMDVKAMPTGEQRAEPLRSMTRNPDRKELMNTPELSRIKAFPGSGGCTFTRR